MSFENRMEDLRRYLDFISELNKTTERLLKAVEVEHIKTLPKKRAVKKKAAVASFKVSVKEGEDLSEIIFSSEKEMGSFMKLKQKTREKQILQAFGKPYEPGEYRTDTWKKERAERLDSINNAFGALSIQITRL